MEPFRLGAQAPTHADRCAARLTQEARCNQLIRAAIRIFAQKGFQGTKTKEIAEAAGINEALIFRDFQSKEKLYCAILEYGSSRMNTEQWIADLSVFAGNRDDHALFSTLALKFFDTFSRERELYRLMLYSALEQHELAGKFREKQFEPVERFIKKYIVRRQRDGAFRDADAHALARSFLSMCHNHVLRLVLFDEAADPAAYGATASTLTEVFLNGVRSR